MVNQVKLETSTFSAAFTTPLHDVCELCKEELYEEINFFIKTSNETYSICNQFPRVIIYVRNIKTWINNYLIIFKIRILNFNVNTQVLRFLRKNVIRQFRIFTNFDNSVSFMKLTRNICSEGVRSHHTTSLQTCRADDFRIISRPTNLFLYSTS